MTKKLLFNNKVNVITGGVLNTIEPYKLNSFQEHNTGNIKADTGNCITLITLPGTYDILYLKLFKTPVKKLETDTYINSYVRICMLDKEDKYISGIFFSFGTILQTKIFDIPEGTEKISISTETSNTDKYYYSFTGEIPV